MQAYSDFYSYLLGRTKKVECYRCHREFDEETDELEPDLYGGMLCESCRTPTMAIYVPPWQLDMAEDVR